MTERPRDDSENEDPRGSRELPDLAEELKAFDAASFEDWKARVEADLGAAGLERLSYRTLDGLEVKPLYGPAPPGPAAFPGQAPYTRGGAPRPGWMLLQEYAHPSLGTARDNLKEDLRRGAGGLWLTFDDYLRRASAVEGLDRKDAVKILARGGLGADTAQDLGRFLEGVDLGATALHLEAGAGALATAAALAEVARAREVPFSGLRGSLGCDPLGTLARFGSCPESLLDDLVTLARICADEAPSLRAGLVSTSLYHEAGASPAQELAFGLATGVEMLRTLEEGGLSLEDATGQLVFSFSVTGDLFQEMAKLRAARQLWSRAVAHCGGGEEAQRLWLHARTSRRDRTERDRGVNALRGTVETFAAVCGGADAVTTGPYDEALGPATAFGRKVAANTQLMLREESFLARVQDPAGGSWYVESLTDALAEAAWDLFREIEGEGGMKQALTSGSIARRVEASAAEGLRQVARRKRPITGVSEFPDLSEAEYDAGSREPARQAAEARLRAWEENCASLDGLTAASGRGRFDAVRAALATGCRFHQVAAAAAGSETLEAPALEPAPTAAPFEALRQAAEDFQAREGHRPRIFLAALGPFKAHRPRTGFTQGALAAGGFETVGGDGDGAADAQAAGEAFAASGCEAAVLCASDELYGELSLAVARELKERGAKRVLLAGAPGSGGDDGAKEAFAEEQRQAGVDTFLHLGCDVLEVLQGLHRDLVTAGDES